MRWSSARAIVVLAPEIGAYSAPLAMLIGFGGATLLLFLNGQRGKKPLNFPYREVVRAILLASVVGAAFQLLPEMATLAELGIALALIALYLGLLIVFRVVPPNHWYPLLHMARSLARGTPVNLNPRKGLRTLDEDEREALRVAVISGEAGRGAGPRGRRPRRGRGAGRDAEACGGGRRASGSGSRPRSIGGSRSSCSKTRPRRFATRRWVACSRTGRAPTTCARSRTSSPTSPACPTTPGRVGGPDGAG